MSNIIHFFWYHINFVVSPFLIPSHCRTLIPLSSRISSEKPCCLLVIWVCLICQQSLFFQQLQHFSYFIHIQAVCVVSIHLFTNLEIGIILRLPLVWRKCYQVLSHLFKSLQALSIPLTSYFFYQALSSSFKSFQVLTSF